MKKETKSRGALYEKKYIPIKLITEHTEIEGYVKSFSPKCNLKSGLVEYPIFYNRKLTKSQSIS